MAEGVRICGGEGGPNLRESAHSTLLTGMTRRKKTGISEPRQKGKNASKSAGC